MAEAAPPPESPVPGRRVTACQTLWATAVPRVRPRPRPGPRPSSRCSRLPPGLQHRMAWLLSQWPGRVALRSAASCMRLGIFDRSMTLAAQFFTSVLPILILAATWVGSRDTNKLADALNMPDESRKALEDAVGTSTGGVRHRRHPDGADLRHQPVAGLHPGLRDHLGRPETQELDPLRVALARGRGHARAVPGRAASARRGGRRAPTTRAVAAARGRGLRPRRWPCSCRGCCCESKRATPAAAHRRADLRRRDVRRASRRGRLAAQGARVERRPLRHHRSGLHLHRLVVRRGVDLPGGRGPGPRDQRPTAAASEHGSAGAGRLIQSA